MLMSSGPVFAARSVKLQLKLLVQRCSTDSPCCLSEQLPVAGQPSPSISGEHAYSLFSLALRPHPPPSHEENGLMTIKCNFLVVLNQQSYFSDLSSRVRLLEVWDQL